MKRRRETTEVFEALHETLDGGVPGALAVVTGVEGSSYRRPGALLFVDSEGRTTGEISGGCLEEDVRLHALRAMQAKASRVVEYDTSDTALTGLGLGCDGRIQLLVRPFELFETDRVSAAVGALWQSRAVAVVWEVAGDRTTGWAVVAEDAGGTPRSPLEGLGARALRDGADRVERTGSARVFSALLPPVPCLVICGGGDDGVPIARLAASVGFDVHLVGRGRDVPPFGVHSVCRDAGDTRGLPTASRDMVLIKTHSLAQDVEWLRSFRNTGVGYIGVMGPRSRIDRMREVVGPDPRIFGPTGLDLGGQGREQIAVSIVAELLAVHNGRGGGHLRDRSRSIHAAP